MWARRSVRVGLPLAVAVLLATFLPGWSMLLVALPVGWAVVEAVRGRVPHREVEPLAPEARPGARPALDADRAHAEWLGWLAAGLETARAAEARRAAHARVAGPARGAGARPEVPADPGGA